MLSVDNVPYPPGGPDFHGLMFVPVSEDDHGRGLLAFDRESRRPFDANARVIASALAALIANLMGDPIVQWGRLDQTSAEIEPAQATAAESAVGSDDEASPETITTEVPYKPPLGEETLESSVAQPDRETPPTS